MFKLSEKTKEKNLDVNLYVKNSGLTCASADVFLSKDKLRLSIANSLMKNKVDADYIIGRLKKLVETGKTDKQILDSLMALAKIIGMFAPGDSSNQPAKITIKVDKGLIPLNIEKS